MFCTGCAQKLPKLLVTHPQCIPILARNFMSSLKARHKLSFSHFYYNRLRWWYLRFRNFYSIYTSKASMLFNNVPSIRSFIPHTMCVPCTESKGGLSPGFSHNSNSSSPSFSARARCNHQFSDTGCFLYFSCHFYYRRACPTSYCLRRKLSTGEEANWRFQLRICFFRPLFLPNIMQIRFVGKNLTTFSEFRSS